MTVVIRPGWQRFNELSFNFHLSRGDDITEENKKKKKKKEKTSRSAISGSRLKIIITLQPRPFRYFSFDLTSDHNREKHVADAESSQRFPTRFDVVERRYRNMDIQSCVYTSLHNNYSIIRIARYYLIIRIRSSYKQRRFSLTYVFYINIRIMFRWRTVVVICFQKHIFYERIGVHVFYERMYRAYYTKLSGVPFYSEKIRNQRGNEYKSCKAFTAGINYWSEINIEREQ